MARLVKANEETGRDCGALILTMIIADETDAAAKAKWEHYKAGTDLEALAYRDEQAEDDPSTDVYAQPNRRRLFGTNRLPTNQGVLVGSYATVARMLDELSDCARRARRHDDVRRFRHRHGAVRHPHHAADALPRYVAAGRMSGGRSLPATTIRFNTRPRRSWPHNPTVADAWCRGCRWGRWRWC